MTDDVRRIVESVLAGDLNRYREIVRLFEDDVFRLAVPVLGSRSAAEDVTQEVFISAYRRLDVFDVRQPFRPWLMGIARNTVRNELRRRSRDAARVELYSIYLHAVSTDTASSNTQDVLEALAKCRDGLTDVAAAAIHGRYDDGLELSDLAGRLQRSLTATRQLLYRTRLTLRDCIESHLSAAGSES